jgi:hypothetical protein
MSENYDSENNPEITASIDNDDDDNVIVGDSSESTINQVLIICLNFFDSFLSFTLLLLLSCLLMIYEVLINFFGRL